MKLFFVPVLFLISVFSLFAQKPDEVLATANGQSFTAKSLPAEAANLWNTQSTVIANVRTQLITQMVTDQVLEAESTARNLPVEKLLEEVKTKAPDPTPAEVLKVYNVNKAKIGNETLEQVSPRIVKFLRGENEEKAVQEYLKTLVTKYDVKYGRDVNAVDMKSMEMVFSINGKSVSAQEFEEKVRISLSDFRAEIYDAIKEGLDDAIYSALLPVEAKSLNLEQGDLIAREITNKMRDYTPSEQDALQTAFQRRLFAKYTVKYLLKEPEIILRNVATDDDPAQGKATAPVTVVMFSDFQCSACSATHPVLKAVLAEYGDQVRLVVRDYPVVQIHANAFQAALAANAANAQGKFFEYTEVLYKNQDALDPVSLKKYAAGLGLNLKQFELDLASEKNAAEIRKDMADGRLYGVIGTPTIFVNGVKVRGVSTRHFRDAIDKALKK
jgi:protein-disulfide isomerase